VLRPILWLCYGLGLGVGNEVIKIGSLLERLVEILQRQSLI